MKRLVVTLVAATLGLGAAAADSRPAAEAPGLCAPAAGPPQLRIHTAAGAITVQLFEDAAPRALGELAALVRERRVYAGASFAYTRPHQEVRLRPAPGAAATLTTQLDAVALGLDRERVQGKGQAMDVLQRELLDAFAKSGKRAEPGSPLASWLDTWYRTRDPGFLVGTSRQAINEALGYRYQSGLRSRPPSRGTVALRPASPTRASTDLSFLLSDMPSRAGRWMVIGRVTQGLELVEKISLRPRAEGMRGYKAFEPADPLDVASLELRCGQRSTMQTKPSAEGRLSSPLPSRVDTRQR